MAPGGKQEDGDGPWTKEARAQFMKCAPSPLAVHADGRRKQAGQYFDPCNEAAERTYRCLTRNEGDRDMCRDYFE
jgi:cytochrome c oxidase assembly protein subunit 23